MICSIMSSFNAGFYFLTLLLTIIWISWAIGNGISIYWNYCKYISHYYFYHLWTFAIWVCLRLQNVSAAKILKVKIAPNKWRGRMYLVEENGFQNFCVRWRPRQAPEKGAWSDCLACPLVDRSHYCHQRQHHKHHQPDLIFVGTVGPVVL